MTLKSIISENIGTLIFIGAALVIVFLYFFIKRYFDVVAPKKRLESNDSEMSLKTVKRILEKYVKRNDGRAIYDIEVGSNRTKGSADAVLIGYFGVLVVITCALSGDLFVNDKDPNLIQKIKEDRRIHENPILKAQQAIKAVTELLREKRVFRVPVEYCVVFTASKTNVNVPRSLNGYTAKEFSEVLRTDRFLNDNKVDVDATTNAILGMSPKNKTKK